MYPRPLHSGSGYDGAAGGDPSARTIRNAGTQSPRSPARLPDGKSGDSPAGLISIVSCLVLPTNQRTALAGRLGVDAQILRLCHQLFDEPRELFLRVLGRAYIGVKLRAPSLLPRDIAKKASPLRFPHRTRPCERGAFARKRKKHADICDGSPVHFILRGLKYAGDFIAKNPHIGVCA